MQFAVFYKPSTGYVAGSIPPRFDGPKEPIEALGSDGVLILDGRYGVMRCVEEARSICRQRGFIGFTLHEGQSFTHSAQRGGYYAMESIQ